MNMLTTDVLINIVKQINPECVLHPTTSAYVTALVKPYAEVLETASVEGMQQWLPLAFPGKLAEGARSEMDKTVAMKIGTHNDTEKAAKGVELSEEETYDTTSPLIVVAAKEAIIYYLVSEILKLACNRAREFQDENVVPWDVQYGLGNDEELSKMFGVTKDMTKLPVDVFIDHQKFTHEFTHEFVAGLLVFGNYFVGNHDFNMSMFGVDVKNTAIPDRFYFDDRYHIYGIDAGIKYGDIWLHCGFYTPDFMHGFSTAAMWVGVDHHNYWRDLTKYDRTGAAVVEENLTF